MKNDFEDAQGHIKADNISPIPDSPRLLGPDSGWVRNERNLLSNFYSMYQPEVVYVPEWDDGEGYPYLMWFFAWAYNQENEPQGDYPGYPGGTPYSWPGPRPWKARGKYIPWIIRRAKAFGTGNRNPSTGSPCLPARTFGMIPGMWGIRRWCIRTAYFIWRIPLWAAMKI